MNHQCENLFQKLNEQKHKLFQDRENVMNFSFNICRLCLSESDTNLQSLFDYYDEANSLKYTDLTEALLDIHPVELNSRACKKCLSILGKIRTFKDICERSNETWLRLDKQAKEVRIVEGDTTVGLPVADSAVAILENPVQVILETESAEDQSVIYVETPADPAIEVISDDDEPLSNQNSKITDESSDKITSMSPCCSKCNKSVIFNAKPVLMKTQLDHTVKCSECPKHMINYHNNVCCKQNKLKYVFVNEDIVNCSQCGILLRKRKISSTTNSFKVYDPEQSPGYSETIEKKRKHSSTSKSQSQPVKDGTISRSIVQVANGKLKIKFRKSSDLN